jgi:hypothetical protein
MSRNVYICIRIVLVCSCWGTTLEFESPGSVDSPEVTSRRTTTHEEKLIRLGRDSPDSHFLGNWWNGTRLQD